MWCIDGGLLSCKCKSMKSDLPNMKHSQICTNALPDFWADNFEHKLCIYCPLISRLILVIIVISDYKKYALYNLSFVTIFVSTNEIITILDFVRFIKIKSHVHKQTSFRITMNSIYSVQLFACDGFSFQKSVFYSKDRGKRGQLNGLSPRHLEAFVTTDSPTKMRNVMFVIRHPDTTWKDIANV